MADGKRVFRCQQCGYAAPKWLGRCPDCQSWQSMVEELVLKGRERHGQGENACRNTPVLLREIASECESRLLCGLEEWDRVLGGGLIPGSFVLLAGDPGIGKSTLLLQVLARMACERRVLYVSGEESPQQIKIRADRLGIDSTHLWIFAETVLEAVLDSLDRTPTEILVVDSIQTLYAQNLEAAPGSVSQVRECASRLMRVAKASRVSTFVVGHVTKEGSIAGPKALEHLVDTVLYLEGDRTHTFRLLRAVKNRYGSTNEVGVFEMKEAGLQEVANPSQFLLAERPRGVSGSVVTCSVEGTRPLLVELQALVSGTNWMQPKRTAIGVDGNRLSLLLAVLEKKLGLNFAQQDVFVNVAGGVRLTEPAADLALAAALLSSYLDRSVPEDWVVWGEVGLAGEVRGVGHSPLRTQEAGKLGFRTCLMPGSNADAPGGEGSGARGVGVRSLSEVMELLFGGQNLTE